MNFINFSFARDSSTILLVSTLGIVILIVGTGLYEADPMPKDEILVSISIVVLLLIGFIQSKHILYIDPKILLGFIIFNGFFILRLLIPTTQEVETKTFFIHVISLGIFVAVYSACIQSLSIKKSNFLINIKPELILAYISISALAILLSTQLAEFHSEINMIHFRPGGYLNPNTTAAIALILAYSVRKLMQTGTFQLVAIILAACIILLSQSRSALLAFIPFIAYIFFNDLNKIKGLAKNVIITSIILTILLMIALISSPELREFPSAFFHRFISDVSSSIRLSLLKSGWISFTEAPLWGNGYRYVATYADHSTHNEIVETLANFGLMGLLIISIACYFLYIPFSGIFLIVCIFPAFLFTHNFFDSYAYQASLGLALATERNYLGFTKSKLK